MGGRVHVADTVSCNTEVETCEENMILSANVAKEALEMVRMLFDNVSGRLGVTYQGWRQSATTRLFLQTAPKGTKAVVDDDPDSIQWPTVRTFRQQRSYTCTLPFVPQSELKHIRWLGTFRYVSLVRVGEQLFVYKSIEGPETVKDWEKEFMKLTKFLSSPFIVDIVGSITAWYPYPPDGEDVVQVFFFVGNER